ncbi:MAG: NINE protein [Nostoc sp. DedQUE08]|uniref:NINE protein n=2 Tax=unclassified Nostoc TaxID=2593658 RepID=UPI002AD3E313|nr:MULTISPECIES: NINE protein [unclassified Nostoc]MDZ8065991.1 NINE protein [Nostoc sp. DedQUE08]MDZ8093896.1 NINE protein [Nostoc sp. DedQUE05]
MVVLYANRYLLELTKEVNVMKTKSTAIILCFFGGWLGIHKFYLGENVAGILYLLFFWTCIPSLIAFVEFFVLVLMSDTEFNTKYNQVIASTSGAVSAKDATSALADLKNLFDSGIITAEEYEEKRQKLLKSL